jgi:hypothetical protein
MSNDKPILIVGADRVLVDRLVAALPPGSTRLAEQLSFTDAMEARAHTLVSVESLTRSGAAPSAPGSLAPLVQAAEAPSVSRVIVVTTRLDTDDELRRLRRSGARYVIVRPPAIVDPDELRGRRLLVPRDTADAPFVTTGELIAALARAICDSSLMGVTIDVPPSGLASLEAAGVKPRVVAPWRAKVGRWLRQPVFMPGDARPQADASARHI